MFPFELLEDHFKERVIHNGMQLGGIIPINPLSATLFKLFGDEESSDVVL